MDALVDLEIAELGLLMETQNQTPDSFDFQGDSAPFTPELYLSNAPAPYAPYADPFEAEWLALQLAPDTVVSNDAAAKSDSVFTEDEDEIVVPGTLDTSGGGGFAGFISSAAAIMMQSLLDDNGATFEDEIIVIGDRTQADQEQFYYDFLDNMNWIAGAQMIFGPGDIRDVLRVPEGSRVYNEAGELQTPSETIDGMDIYSGNDGPDSSWDRIPDNLEGGRIVIQTIAGSYTIPIPGSLIFL